MLNVTQEIYCDESGFSGNNLLDQVQPFFVYASIAISHEEAADCVDELIKTYGVQGGELKGRTLVKYNKGRKAASTILDRYHDRLKVVVFDKKYALACKFFEYIFEPTISSVNSIFYGIQFHRFISNVLHMHFKAEAKYADEIFTEFQSFIRCQDGKSTDHLFPQVDLSEISPVLKSISEFSVLNREIIIDELESLRGSNWGKWTLDLTDSSLQSLLSHWGEKYEQLHVHCDSSKPLQEVPEIFDTMVGRTDRKYIEFNGKKRPLTYNLKERIKFVDSVQFPGIQLADVAAAAFGYMFQFPHDDISKKWGQHFECLHEDCNIPDYDHIDLNKPEVIRNIMLLEELCGRSRNRDSLTDNIQEFLNYVTYRLAIDPPHF